MWSLGQARMRDIWIKSAVGVAAVAFLVAAAYAGGGWKPQAPVYPEPGDAWDAQCIEEGIEGPAVGTDAPNAVQDYFPTNRPSASFRTTPRPMRRRTQQKTVRRLPRHPERRATPRIVRSTSISMRTSMLLARLA